MVHLLPLKVEILVSSLISKPKNQYKYCKNYGPFGWKSGKLRGWKISRRVEK